MGLCWTNVEKGLVGIFIILLGKQLQGQICDSGPRVPPNMVFKVFINQPLEIKCTVILCSGKDRPKITWSKQDEFEHITKLKTTANIHFDTKWTNKSVISFLSFVKVSIDDAGLYRCKDTIFESNEIRVIVNDVRDCQLELSVSDDCFWNIPVSGSFTLSCRVTHYSNKVDPTAAWCREDGDSTCVPLQVGSGTRHTLVSNQIDAWNTESTLTIQPVSLPDSGNYRCVVSLPDYCSPNSRTSQPQQLYVTRKESPTEKNCGEENAEERPLRFVIDLVRVVLFVTMTMVFTTLTTRWILLAIGRSMSEKRGVHPDQSKPLNKDKSQTEMPISKHHNEDETV